MGPSRSRSFRWETLGVPAEAGGRACAVGAYTGIVVALSLGVSAHIGGIIVGAVRRRSSPPIPALFRAIEPHLSSMFNIGSGTPASHVGIVSWPCA